VNFSDCVIALPAGISTSLQHWYAGPADTKVCRLHQPDAVLVYTERVLTHDELRAVHTLKVLQYGADLRIYTFVREDAHVEEQSKLIRTLLRGQPPLISPRRPDVQ
jgi:hypothetical protein